MWKKQLADSWDAFRRARRAGVQKSLEATLADLQDPDAKVRWKATTEVQRFSGPEAVAALITALEDPAAQVRAGAALSLGILQAPEAVGPLLDHFLNDEAGHVRAICGSFLDRFDDPRVADAFLTALQDPEWKVVIAACVGIELRGIAEAVPSLLQLLDHPHHAVREHACSALLALGVRDPKIISTLEVLAEDPETVERERFGEELTRLLSEEIGDEEPPPVRRISQLLDEVRRPPDIRF